MITFNATGLVFDDHQLHDRIYINDTKQGFALPVKKLITLHIENALAMPFPRDDLNIPVILPLELLGENITTFGDYLIWEQKQSTTDRAYHNTLLKGVDGLKELQIYALLDDKVVKPTTQVMISNESYLFFDPNQLGAITIKHHDAEARIGLAGAYQWFMNKAATTPLSTFDFLEGFDDAHTQLMTQLKTDKTPSILDFFIYYFGEKNDYAAEEKLGELATTLIEEYDFPFRYCFT